MEKIRLDRPVIVEGKYDKIKLSSVIETDIIPTDGFGIFRSDEKKAFLRRLAAEHGLFILTDADQAGRLIRNYFNSILPKEQMIHLYTPPIPGREKRKKTDSKEGLLGVEGMEASLLRSLFAPYALQTDDPLPVKAQITKARLYEDGLLGTENSAIARERFCRLAGLPTNLSSNALMDAIRLLLTEEQYAALKDQCRYETT